MDNESIPNREDIAIIGMDVRVPGARNIEEFWSNLQNGVESVCSFSAEELAAAGVTSETLKDPNFVNSGAQAEDLDCFDALFFGISPREAQIMDPQHRVFLEAAWAVLERAGYDPEQFKGLIGVFGGLAPNTYRYKVLDKNPAILEGVGEYLSMICSEREYAITRTAFKLNLCGPSLCVNTACSTSGVALHLACQSLLSGENDMCLVGGARVRAPLSAGYVYQEDGIPSPDGHCRAFDAEARGTVIGNGIGMILIKRLSDALRDGDWIHAIVRGTAVSNDGAAKVGFTAPGVRGQSAAIAEAIAMAGISAETIQYLEAHGTGTALGDPIEIAAATKAFRESTDQQAFCAIGSVKTNIGHLDAGAGVAGIIKTALALENRLIPPSLNYKKPNPQIDFENSPFYVNDKLSEWPRNGHPRRAGVSSFGLGGTNAHIILEEAPQLESSSSGRPWHLLVLSAKTDTALHQASKNLAMHLKMNPELSLADVAYTLKLGRRAFNHRRMLVCQKIEDAVSMIEIGDPQHVISSIQPAKERNVVFMFSGQGSQYIKMGSELYAVESTFREQVDVCAEILKPSLNLDIRQVLFPQDTKLDEASELLNQTHMTQPALFVIEYALAKMWSAWGVQPQAMIGHSIGEYVAACLAGVFSLESALALVATRGRLMQQLPPGAMLAVPLPEEEVKSHLGERLSLAAVNSPMSCVVSGPISDVDALQHQLLESGIECRRLHTSHAFHSAMMDPILETFAERVKEIDLQPPHIPYISNVSGTWISAVEATDPSYWANHIRQTVKFSDGLQVLLQDSEQIVLEVGPGQTLSTFARRHPKNVKSQDVVSSLRHPKEQTPEFAFLLNSLGRLWLAGVKIDWSQFYALETRLRVPLPTYPFERKRYWVEAITHAREPVIDSTLLTEASPDESQTLTIDRQYMDSTPRLNRSERIVSELKSLIEDLTGIDPTDIDIHATFLELGFDSLLLTQANAAIKKTFEVKILFRQLFEEFSTINSLAGYIDTQLPPEAFPDKTQEVQLQLRNPITPVSSIESLPGNSAFKSMQPGKRDLEDGEAGIESSLENMIIQQIQTNTKLLEILRDRNRHQGHFTSSSTSIMPQPSGAIDTKDISGIDVSMKRDRWELDFKAELSALSGRESTLARELGIQGMDVYDGLEHALNDLCSAYVCQYFQSCDIKISDGCQYKVLELQRILRVVPKFEKFFHYMLKVLTEDKVIKCENDEILFLEVKPALKDPQSLKDSLMSTYPQFMGIFEMLDHCAQHFRDALSGEMPAIQVLFPDGTRDLIKRNLEDNTIEHQRLRIYKLLTKELILKLAANSPVRILEVGAGSGSLTWELAEALKDRDVTYYFTDIGRAFVNAAKKEADRRGLGMMKFGVLDIAKDSEEQGFKPESFDIILALNVVHATPNIESTLGNLKKLLMPRGFICLIELVTAHRWTNLVWGTTEGWWYFNDGYREHTPLVGFDQWERACQNQSFGFVHALPFDAEKRSRTDSGLFLAMRNEPSPTLKGGPSAEPKRVDLVGEGISGLSPQKLVKDRTRSLSTTQQQHLDALIKRFTARTKESKRLTQAYRTNLADPRTAAGFQLPWKELVYPIFAAKSYGSKLLDVDGNEWLDITMGFGVSIFGHSPPFIVEAIEKQLKETMATGPQTALSGQVADLVCEFTGMERVAFCNTGSEAVLAAIRMARHVTGRERIAVFSGAYHGIFDEVLVKSISSKGRKLSIPVASGIPRKAVEDVLVLDYGDFHSLDMIKDYANELAAVLVEPIQSRNPEIQPREFLHALRDLTEKKNLPLIFDEMITGFRLHFGGAQAHFGVKADIAAYGKVVGGGMPIGIVGGKAEYLDALDGGMWNFGDDSVPEVGTTWFAGTFVRHPLSLAAAHAALSQLKKCGPKLLEDVNQKTSKFAGDLNHYFEQSQLPIRIVHFATLFLIRFIDNHQFSGLFWHYLRDSGIHCHEGRPNYLTVAHTEEDIAILIEAFKKAGEEMRAGGFLAESPALGSSEKRVLSSPESRVTVEKMEAFESGFREIPLTDAQLEIWLATCLGNEASCAFNVSTSLCLKGPLNVDLLRRAMNQVCNRHEALRTTIVKNGDYQRIAETLQIEMPFIDLSIHQANKRDAEIHTFKKNEVEEPFDLVKGPLFRARIVKMGQEEHLVIFTVHHIICDGWSLEIILQDLSACYSSLMDTASVELQKTLQFSEFTQWLRDEQDKSSVTDTESFWLEPFSENVPTLELPTDRPRPPIKTYSCRQQSITIQSTQYRELDRLAKENGCTIFSLLLAAYYILLQRLSGQEDIVVGLAAGGQSSLGNKKLVGHCVNLLPIRNHINPGQKVSDSFSIVRNLLCDAFEHQHYSFSSLIKKLNLSRDLSRIPLISTIITYETSARGIHFEGLDSTIKPNLRNFCNFDLEFYLKEADDEIILRFDYNTDLFDDLTIRRWLDHYQCVLKSIVANPNEKISNLSILEEHEKTQILVEWNNTQSDYPQTKCMHYIFEEQVEKTPNASAVIFEGKHLTYTQLNKQANQVAHYLQKRGVQQETPVGICVERSFQMIVGLMGILKAGGAYVPLDPTYPKERLSLMLHDAKVPLLLTQNRLQESIPLSNTEVLCLDSDWGVISGESEENAGGHLQSNNLAYVIFTSGSSGRPKGVAIEHRSVVQLISWSRETFSRKELSGVLCSTSICFDLSVFEIFVTLSCGGKIILAENVLQLPEIPAANEVTLINTVPSAIKELLNLREVPKSVRTINLAGEPLKGSLVRTIYEKTSVEQVYDLYGPSEDTVYSTFSKRNIDSPETIGKPIANTQVYILDPHLHLVPIGVPGELHIGGDGLARGYLNRPELTKERFIPNPFNKNPQARLYKSGDLARFLPDGQIEFLGRLDHQVKIRGFRIELGEIESALALHPDIRESVVSAKSEQTEDKRLVAYLVSSSGSISSVSDLRIFLNEKLPQYMIPSAFVWLDALPLTPNGKVDREKLPAKKQSLSEAAETYVAPRNSLERQVVIIWQDVLGQNPIGVTDNFFDLGGESLLAVRLARALERVLQTKISISMIFQTQTIERLVKILAKDQPQIPSRAPATESCLVPIKTSGSNIPIFCMSFGNTFRPFMKDYPDQPLYGIYFTRAHNGFPISDLTLEDLAAQYVKEIREIQPNGPYYLAGYSFGGLVAYEMARQLLDKREVVAFLALVDPTTPFLQDFSQPQRQNRLQSISKADVNEALTSGRRGDINLSLLAKIPRGILGRLQSWSWKKQLKEIFFKLYFIFGYPLPPYFRKFYYNTIKDNLANQYVPGPYAGGISLFQTDTRLIRYWSELCMKVERVYDVPVGHLEITDGFYAEALYTQLMACLKEAQTQGGRSRTLEHVHTI